MKIENRFVIYFAILLIKIYDNIFILILKVVDQKRKILLYFYKFLFNI